MAIVILLAVSAMAQVGINTDNSAPDNSAMLDVKSATKGFLPPRVALTAADVAGPVTSPAAGLFVYNTATSGTAPNNVVPGYYCWNGARWVPAILPQGSNPGDMLYWNGAQWVAIAAGSNGQVLTYFNGLPVWTLPTYPCGVSFSVPHLVGRGVAPVDKTVVYGTVNGIPGESTKCWITQNLGADHKATAGNDTTEASAGWYWQFNSKQGYKHDGTNRTPNTTWISSIDQNSDWIAANDPCTIELGAGWRIPTSTEWTNVDDSTGGNWSNWNGPWNSGLALHGAGFLNYDGGSLLSRGSQGNYWSRNAAGSDDGWDLNFNSGESQLVGNVKAYGFTLRCLRDGSTTSFIPEVITSQVTSITQSAATGGGNVTFDGGAVVTARGVCWSTSSNPTTADSHTTDGNGTGTFTSSLSGLAESTTYHIRSYATNSVGTSYGNELTFTTLTLPTITTMVVTNVTTNIATSGGNITSDGYASVTARGVCWSTSPQPTTADSFTTDGSGTGIFTSSITGLSANTLYHVRAYATNIVGTSYGNELTFTTLTLPTVTTVTVTNVTATTATSGGNVIYDGGATVTARGVCWSTTSNPTTSNSITTNGSGTGTFTSSLTGLTANTLYHVRAYATSIAGTGYGNEISFSTLPPVLPTVTTTAITNITCNTATSGGNVSSDGGATVTARGVCWSTTSNPTTSNSITTDGSGIGTFTSNITGLTPGPPCRVRAYATNSVGTSYGTELIVIMPNLPSLSSLPVSEITQTTATSGGNVVLDGGVPVSARGVCWSTSSGPLITGSHTTDGIGTGPFTSIITGLAPGTQYHVRAYATNCMGTSYGSEFLFTTLTLPTVTTAAITNITQTTATSGGNVTSDGGATITARGVCWSTSPAPVATGSHTTDAGTTGSYTSNLTGLVAGTLYYIRAYATNSVGTSYGNELTFTTLSLPTVTTAAVTNIAQTTATGGGNVTYDGGTTVTFRGVCWSTTSNPTTSNSITTDGNGTGTFTSSLTGLGANTLYHVRAYAANSVGTSYGSDVTFTTSPTTPSITTTAVTSITQTNAASGGNVTSDGGATVTARGVCWSTTSGPVATGSHTTDGSGTGTFTSSLTGLTKGTLYFVRAYAINSAGTAYGSEVSFTTLFCGDPLSINHQTAGGVAPVAKSVTYGTVTNVPGETAKCWITGNLGADHQATAVNDGTEPSAGWYWQFNRKQGYKHDGTTLTPNTTWINAISETSSWTAANDPCAIELGTGWRIPTSTEWSNVDGTAGGNWTSWNGPWNSGLKLHGAGFLNYTNGTLANRGAQGNYWSSTGPSSTTAYDLNFNSGLSEMVGNNKAYGFTLRCLRDN